MIKILVLASASAARARLLASAGLDFRVEPAGIDENLLVESWRAQGKDAAGCALALAEAKAHKVAAGCSEAIVIGADQILVCGEEWLDKPTDLNEARTQLLALRGCRHQLVTAVCAVQSGSRLWHAVDIPHLTMRHFTEAFLDDYMAAEGRDIIGSVGAYRLEGRGIQLFENIDGDYFSILGLPLMQLLDFLRGEGVIPS
jgi:nucleoside triphosphate pyrophosphatase